MLRDCETVKRLNEMQIRTQFSSGFTFVEILAALIFLAILVPAVLEGLTISSRISVISERNAIAANLAQNKLNELTINGAWAAADAGGDFGKDWPGYRYEVTQSTWDMDSMTAVAVKVFYSVQGSEQSVSLSTLVNPSEAGTSTSSSTSSSKTK